MKRTLILLLVAGAAFAAASFILSQRQAARHAAQLAQLQAAWEAEKAQLQAALEAAQEQARLAGVSANRAPLTPATPSLRLSPKELMARLQALRLAPGAAAAPILRQAVFLLEQLVQAGPAALPVIREFLARYEDTDLDTSLFQGRGVRDRLPLDFALPPSLRMGLFDVVRRIGGLDAEKILAESLGRTGRGVEVGYLARLLEEMAPDKYREPALSAARALLANPGPFAATSPLDRNHRDYLYGVLSLYGDSAYAGEAQAQLVRADSQLDRGALRYLQQTLGAQAVPIVAQAYENPLLTNSSGKEPLARLALSFVGADPQANEFYQKTINDPLLTRSDRKNLIEDLNQDGFADTRNLTARDLPLIQNRIALIEQLAPQAMDDANAAAFKEAYKDLINMRDRLAPPPAPALPSANQSRP
jgi:hypothetical protein